MQGKSEWKLGKYIHFWDVHVQAFIVCAWLKEGVWSKTVMQLKYVYLVSVCISVTGPGKWSGSGETEMLEKAEGRAIGVSEVLEKTHSNVL